MYCNYMCVCVLRSGTIKADMFDELKERLEAAADAAHEEYCDAVKVCVGVCVYFGGGGGDGRGGRVFCVAKNIYVSNLRFNDKSNLRFLSA